jgi:hypothetical protein
MFKEPQLIIKKRNAKLLDYERVEAQKQRGERVDKSELESADAFESINTQLCEEMPIFFGLVQEYIIMCAQDVIRIQSEFYGHARTLIRPLANIFIIDGFNGEGRVALDYSAAMAPGREAEQAARDIRLLTNWCDSIWGSGSFNLDREIRHSSATISRQPSAQSLNHSLIDFASVSNSPRPSQQYLEPRLYSNPSLLPGIPLLYPNHALPDNHFRVQALYHFEAEMNEELDLEEGDIIIVDGGIERNGSTEWWNGRSSRGYGWFPCNFTVPIE